MKKINLGLSVLTFLPLLLVGCIHDTEQIEGNAPDFDIVDIDGNRLTLSRFRGSIVLLDFMATWCPPCNYEMMELSKLKDEMGDDIVIISIDVDTSENSNDIRNQFGDYVNKWIFALDTDNVASKYGVSAIPKLVLIDENGNIFHTFVGYTQYEELISKIDEMGVE